MRTKLAAIEWTVASGVLALVLAYDPTQSTGPGTHQGANAETSAQPGASHDSKAGKNEDSGSATGAMRDRAPSGMESGSSHGSARPDDSGRSIGQSGAGTTSGAAKSKK